MKKTLLKAVASIAAKNVAKSNRTACLGYTYQPKAPKNIKKFGK